MDWVVTAVKIKPKIFYDLCLSPFDRLNNGKVITKLWEFSNGENNEVEQKENTITLDFILTIIKTSINSVSSEFQR